MGRKDYILIAETIKNMDTSSVQGQQINKGHIENLADSFAYMLSQDNPRFDEGKFLVACGVRS